MRQLTPFALGAAAITLALAVVPAACAEEAIPAEPKAGWKTLFDGKTLEGWASADFFKPGKVHLKEGSVVIEKGSEMTGIVYTRKDFPKVDYEVTLEGKRLAGDDFFCTTTFPVGNAFCSFVVGGWGGTMVGLSSVDGADASENETSSARTFKNNQWYRIRIRVTRDRIQTWIDKHQMVDLKTTDRSISVRIECLVCKPFGIATWNTTGAVRDIRVRKLTEAEIKATNDGK